MKNLKLLRLGAIASLSLCSNALVLPLVEKVPALAQGHRQSETVAQLFYPPAKDQKLIRVIGQGKVRQPADLAEIKILVGIQDSLDNSSPFNSNVRPGKLQSGPVILASIQGIAQSSSPRPETVLAPLVDALVKSGLSRDDISAKVPKSRSRVSPFPFPSPSFGKPDAAFVLVKVRKPTKDKIESVMLTAENHLVSSESLRLNDVQVSYKIDQCEPIQLRAFENAVQDAQQRANAIAGAMNATLSPAASVAEPFFNIFAPGCESGQGLSLSGKKYNSYEPSDPIEVVVERLIFSTYTVE